jgi:hypothetical protein
MNLASKTAPPEDEAAIPELLPAPPAHPAAIQGKSPVLNSGHKETGQTAIKIKRPSIEPNA